jgi:hypothetical protein
LQLLRYVVRLLVHWYDQNRQKLPLPPVLPLLAHQGPEGWRCSCEFQDLFGPVPDALRTYLPSFQHALVDLPAVDDKALSTAVGLRNFLMALKYIRRKDLPECIDRVLAEAPALDDNDLRVILSYLEMGPIVLSSKVVHETLLRLVPDRKEKIMGWLTQPYYEQGRAEGKAEGAAEEKAKSLTRLLEKRFGPIPGATRQRVFSADVGSIETWFDRAVDAPDLESVFDSD